MWLLSARNIDRSEWVIDENWRDGGMEGLGGRWAGLSRGEVDKRHGRFFSLLRFSHG